MERSPLTIPLFLFDTFLIRSNNLLQTESIIFPGLTISNLFSEWLKLTDLFPCFSEGVIQF
jgi:hypothetical protein